MQSSSSNGGNNILAKLSGLRLSDGSTAGERIRVVTTPPSVEKQGIATFSTAPSASSASASGPSTPSAASPSSRVTDVTRLLSTGAARLASPPPSAVSVATPSPPAPTSVTTKTKSPVAATAAAKPKEEKVVSVPKPRSEAQDSSGKNAKAVRQGTKVSATAAAQPSASSTAALNPKIAEFFSKHGSLSTGGAVPLVPTAAVPTGSPNGKSAAHVAVVGVLSSSPTTTTTSAPVAGSSSGVGGSTATEGGGGGRRPQPSSAPTAESKRAAMRVNQFLMDAFGHIDNVRADRPLIRSLPKVPAGGRYIIVGDVHGCVDQLEALVEKVRYEKGKDCLVIIGDYVNKGPNSVGVVQACIKHGALGILGNHDYTLLEYIEKSRQRPFRAEDMKDPVKKLAKDFPLECEYYLRGLPHILRLPEYNVLLVHAGLNVQHPLLEDQNVYEVMHLRRLETVVAPDPQHHKKEVAKYTAVVKGSAGVPWGEAWSGPERVIFGHDAKSGFQVHPYATGIDTGCVYGDPLTCVVFSAEYPQGEFFNVPGLPRSANELKGLPPPDAAIYEQLQVEMEKQIIRPTSRSTPSMGSASPLSQRPVFLSTPVSLASQAAGTPTSQAGGSRPITATVTSTNARLTPSAVVFPSARIMTPTTAMGSNMAREVADVSAHEMQKATLLALSAAHELRALGVVLSMPVYESSLEVMQVADASDSVAVESFWVPFIRHMLNAVRARLSQTEESNSSLASVTASGASSPAREDTSTYEALDFAFGVCDDLEKVRKGVQGELKALQDPSLDAKLSTSAKKYLALLIR